MGIMRKADLIAVLANHACGPIFNINRIASVTD